MAESVAGWISPEEYLRRERQSETKHEYFNGQVFAMAGTSKAHVRISMSLGSLLNERLRGRTCEPFGSDMRVKVGETGLYTYPDLSVACEPEFEDAELDVLLNPAVVIEILSPSTERYDRNEKFEHYERIASVQEIWFVRQDRMRIEQNKRIGPRHWLRESFTEGEIVIESLGIAIPIAQVYERVQFDPHPPLR